MKYMILPAKKLQCGDVVFADSNAGIVFCGRVLGQNVREDKPDRSEYRVEVVVGNKKFPEGTHTTISFKHDTKLGVSREDEHASVDVAALLDELDDK
jgi:hypothetical protein